MSKEGVPETFKIEFEFTSFRQPFLQVNFEFDMICFDSIREDVVLLITLIAYKQVIVFFNVVNNIVV